MLEQIVFIAQIIILCWCSYMVWRARQALNGLGRGMLLLFVLLIIRRLDDAFHVLDNTGVLLLSSAVVLIVAYDVHRIYKERETYVLYLQNRRKRIADLEMLRKQRPW